MSLTLPYVLVNGTTADANQVMADLNAIVNFCNNDLQPNLNLPLSVVDGGTGATAGPAACINLGALQAANNLSDVDSFTDACTNIGALQVSNNLSDVASATTALANLGGLAKAANLSDVAVANTALNNILPTQTGHAGDSLVTDGTNASWSSSASSFIGQFQNRQSSGSDSGETLTAGAWNQRVLNTVVVNTIPGAALNSNQITGLPNGTYLAMAQATAYASATATVITMKARLRDVTNSVTLVSGLNVFSASSTGTPDGENATLLGFFTITGSPTIEVDTWVENSDVNSGGLAMTTGDAEVYVNLILQKIT